MRPASSSSPSRTAGVTSVGRRSTQQRTCEPLLTHEWTPINGDQLRQRQASTSRSTTRNTYSKGRLYLSLDSPENDVEAFDADQRPVDFPATASYITDNKTHRHAERAASGKSATSRSTPNGNLYVTDRRQGSGRRVRLDRDLPPQPSRLRERPEATSPKATVASPSIRPTATS